MKKLQYLDRKKDNKFNLTEELTLDASVMVLTKYIVFNTLTKSKTLLEACVYDTTKTAETTPANYFTKFEYVFTPTGTTVKQYFSNGSISNSLDIDTMTSENLNFTDGTTDYRFADNDNEYQIGSKISDFALNALLTMPSLTGEAKLGDEWEIPA